MQAILTTQNSPKPNIYKRSFWLVSSYKTRKQRRVYMENKQNHSSSIRPTNPSINQCFITGEFVIIESPGEPCSKMPASVGIYSATVLGQGTNKGKLSGTAKLKHWKIRSENDTKIRTYRIKIYVEENFGNPGAFVITNHHKHKFFLEYVTLRATNKPTICFDCRSWVYPSKLTTEQRIFFSNTSYLPSKTPEGLKILREEELTSLCVYGRTREPKEWERIYDYDCYNDLGDHDRGREHIRPVLGGTSHPYPRRERTGRPPCKSDPSSESQPQTTSFDIYVPPDERLSLKKQAELISNIIQVTLHFVIPEAYSSSSRASGNFESFEDIRLMYSNLTKEEIEETRKQEERSGMRRLEERNSNKMQEMEKRVMEILNEISPIEFVKKIIRQRKKTKKRQEMEKSAMRILKKIVPKESVKEITRGCKVDRKKFLIPHIIAEGEHTWNVEQAWKDDDEFGRQMLAGINPTRIQCLTSTPPLEQKEMEKFHKKKEEMEKFMEEAGYPILKFQADFDGNRFFILDHHDYLMPFLHKINTTGVCSYASQTLLYRTDHDTLKPVAIKLGLPDSSSDPRVFVRPEEAPWQLAKAHVAANDSVYHQLISHWLHTHAVVEPFIIATRRRLSVMHPIHQLLDPHFKDTMHINALARSILINSGGILEKTLFSGKISMELSSELYKEWRFKEQALPDDLLKRNMAKEDPTHPAGVKLLLEDYPYGEDGLEIWMAIHTWVKDFCTLFYTDDASVISDEEIKAWWEEVQIRGHPDQKTGWYKLTTLSNLIKALTTLIWIASGLHAAVNFGQYAYAAYPPNRPALCRKFIPKEDEFFNFQWDFDKYFLSMLPTRYEMALGVSLMHVLSRHTSDEVYLGQRSSNWTDDERILEKFEIFGKKLLEIEKKIKERNRDSKYKNRWGPAKIPYKLLYPDTSNVGSTGGITGKGIPNSISI